MKKKLKSYQSSDAVMLSNEKKSNQHKQTDETTEDAIVIEGALSEEESPEKDQDDNLAEKSKESSGEFTKVKDMQE